MLNYLKIIIAIVSIAIIMVGTLTISSLDATAAGKRPPKIGKVKIGQKKVVTPRFNYEAKKPASKTAKKPVKKPKKNPNKKDDDDGGDGGGDGNPANTPKGPTFKPPGF